MRLLPEYRKATRSFEDQEISFGTVDCTIHSSLCHTVGSEFFAKTFVFFYEFCEAIMSILLSCFRTVSVRILTAIDFLNRN